MSYTTNRQPQGIPFNLCNVLREALISELVAINDYSKAIVSVENKDLKEIFHHILEDEKRHYGIFLECLRKVDKEEMEKYKESEGHVKVTPTKEQKCENKNSNHKLKGDMLTFIRENMKGELEAVILYNQHEAQVEDEAVKKIFKDISKDEKEHLEELTRALLILDKDKYGPIG